MKTLEKHSPKVKMKSSSKNKKLKTNLSLKTLKKKNMKVEEMMALLEAKRKKLCSRKKRPVLMNSIVMPQTQSAKKDKAQSNEEIAVALNTLNTCKKYQSCPTTTTTISFQTCPNTLRIDSTSMKRTPKLEIT
jgi:hypothetical protein